MDDRKINKQYDHLSDQSSAIHLIRCCFLSSFIGDLKRNNRSEFLSQIPMFHRIMKMCICMCMFLTHNNYMVGIPVNGIRRKISWNTNFIDPTNEDTPMEVSSHVTTTVHVNIVGFETENYCEFSCSLCILPEPLADTFCGYIELF